MSVDRVQKDLIKRLASELMQRDPKAAASVLGRFQFKMKDVTWRLTEKGRLWMEVWRWPWESHPDNNEPWQPPTDE